MEGDIGESELLVFLSMIKDFVVGYSVVGKLNDVICLLVILVISKDDDGVVGIGLVVVVDNAENAFVRFSKYKISIFRFCGTNIYIDNLFPRPERWEDGNFFQIFLGIPLVHDQ